MKCKMLNIFNHEDIKKFVDTEKYNNFLKVNSKAHQFSIFCTRCYKILGQSVTIDSVGCMSYEDQLIHLIILKYFFEGTKI